MSLRFAMFVANCRPREKAEVKIGVADKGVICMGDWTCWHGFLGLGWSLNERSFDNHWTNVLR